MRRRFTFPDFDGAFALVAAVAAVARAQNHHPDVSFGWGYAEFVLTTHAAGCVTEHDVVLAARIDAAAGRP